MSQYLEFFQSHLVLFIAPAVVLALFIANEVHGNMTGGKRVSAAEAVRMINDRDTLVVDIRPQAEFNRGHLLGAFHAPAPTLHAHKWQSIVEVKNEGD